MVRPNWLVTFNLVVPEPNAGLLIQKNIQKCRIFDKFSLLLKELETYPDFNYDKLEENIKNHQRKAGEAYKVTSGHFSKLKHHFIKELEMYIVNRKLNKKSTSLCVMSIQKFLLHLEVQCEGI